MEALRPRALSLAETVVASFLLLMGFLVVARLFHSSLRYQEWIDSVNWSTSVAEAQLDSLRTWSQSPANFRTLETLYSPQVFQEGDFRIEILAGPAVPLASPCSGLEAIYPANRRRMMTRSFKPVQVSVIGRRDRIVLHSLLGDPPREPRSGPGPLGPVQFQATGPNPLNHDDNVRMAAALYDTSNEEIPDVFFDWAADPISGRGTITAKERDGRQATFTHKMMKADGSWGYTPALETPQLPECLVGAWALYRGREYSGNSAPLQLIP